LDLTTWATLRTEELAAFGERAMAQAPTVGEIEAVPRERRPELWEPTRASLRAGVEHGVSLIRER
jgi:hypothetical protein